MIENRIEVQNSRNGIVKNAEVYALKKALVESGYAMKTDISIYEEDEKMIRRGSKLGSAPSGSGHCNYLLGILVRMDVCFTNKVWTEAERYHWFDISTAQSTMHRVTKFDLDNSYYEKVNHRVVDIMKNLVLKYNREEELLKQGCYEGDERLRVVADQKERYLEILYTNPAGFKLTAGISTNYLQLKTIVTQRHKHKLPEWREFTDWCFDLPLFEELTGLKRSEYYNG